MSEPVEIRVGVIGTGHVSQEFVRELLRRSTYRLGKVLTRRPLDSVRDFPRPDALTNATDELIESSDVVFECSGDAVHAAEVIGRVLDTGLPVVTLNSEFHVTVGSHYVARGLLTEAEGDQPGSLAALNEDVLAMGFSPLAYTNMKTFLNRNPTLEDMQYWGERLGYSLPMVTSFTDGTKVQIEQCLVANGLGAGIARQELIGLETDDLDKAAAELGQVADRLGHPISDYILARGLPHGVFIIARHDESQAANLRTLKMGDGPYYTLVRPYCLVHLEVFKTIDRVVRERRPLLNNGLLPRIGVAAVAKRELAPGEFVERGCGGFDLRGICVNIAERPGHLPICLASRMHVRRRVEPGQILRMDDVELPESTALAAWQAIERQVLAEKRRVAAC